MEYKRLKDGFSVVFYRQEGFGETPQKTIQKTSQKTIQKILDLIKANPEITIEQLSQATGVTSQGIKYNLAKLKKQKAIKRIGPDKGGRWQINE